MTKIKDNDVDEEVSKKQCVAITDETSDLSADDFYGAEYTPGASEIKVEMQDHGKKPWKLKHREDAVYISIDMPGCTKETVKARVEDDILFIKGTREYDPEMHTSARISLMPVIPQCKMFKMKGEVKNGVVKIKIPKAKEGERTDIFHLRFN